MLDLVHRIYEADESLRALDFMVHTKLYFSQVILQIFVGTLVPIALLGMTQVWKLTEAARKRIYVAAGSLTLISILAMRWNVVIGGQLFSKSFLGYSSYKMEFATREGLLPAIALLILPFLILWVLVKLLHSRPGQKQHSVRLDTEGRNEQASYRNRDPTTRRVDARGRRSAPTSSRARMSIPACARNCT